MIKIKNLSKNYGITKALDGISFEVNQGEIVGLLGPNGAGKTTAMRIITGFLPPTSGQVEIDNINVVEHPEKVQSQIGYLPETAALYHDLSVREHLEYAAAIHGLVGDEQKQAIKNIAQACGIADKLYFDVSELSKGYKQRVALAQALIHNPKILILDEPSTGLDPNQIIEIRDLIKKLSEEKTIILSTHIMQEVEALCSRVVLINKGKIVADGSVAELKHGQNAVHQINVTIKGNQEEIWHHLKNIAGITSAQQIKHPDKGVGVYTINADQDIRSDINKTMIKAGYDILEIAAKENTMEDVFHELTK
ncbi:MAG: ATP-binding cassette domain-containing protein [Patescibacteria group bacterium]